MLEAEEARGVEGGGFGHGFQRKPFELRHPPRRLDDVRRLVLLPPVGHRGKVGAVRLHHQPLQRCKANGLGQGLRLLVGDDAGNGEVKAQIEVAPGRAHVSGEAMDDALPHLLRSENRGAVRVRVADVDHQRFPEPLGQRRLRAKGACLFGPRRAVVVVVEPGLPDRLHLRGARTAARAQPSPPLSPGPPHAGECPASPPAALAAPGRHLRAWPQSPGPWNWPMKTARSTPAARARAKTASTSGKSSGSR